MKDKSKTPGDASSKIGGIAMEPKPKTKQTTNAVPAHRAQIIDARCYISSYYEHCVPPIECTYCKIHLEQLKRKAKR